MMCLCVDRLWFVCFYFGLYNLVKFWFSKKELFGYWNGGVLRNDRESNFIACEHI